ncbi:MAG: hypothetical protein AAGA09_06710 [Pseudomonadota bacterium]
MRALLLLALRITTGALLIIWGVLKIAAPEATIGVSDKYYGGLLSAENIQFGLGAAQAALGGFVILGLFRVITYPLQALVLTAGALAIWQYLVDPLGLYLLTEETRKILFFPSSTVAVASLIMLAFKSEDAFSLDRLLFRR